MPSWRPTTRPVHVDDLARFGGLGPELLHHRGVVAIGHEADVLAVGLVGDGELVALGQRARLALGHVAERKAQEVELLGRRAEQEVALVARRIGAAMQLGPRLAHQALHVVAGRQRLGAQLARRAEQVAELHRAIAGDAGHRRLAAHVGIGERLHDLGAEAAFVVEHVVRDGRAARRPGGRPGCRAGAAGAGLADGDAMVVELQGDAHDVVALLLEQRRRDRRIDAARHRDHHAGVAGRLVDTEGISSHGGAYIPASGLSATSPVRCGEAGAGQSCAVAACRARPWPRRCGRRRSPPGRPSGRRRRRAGRW